METIDWLLDSDPAIRWQAMRDLAHASPDAIAAERARIPIEGVGAAILACQGSDGAWHRSDAPDWLPTLFTMMFLRATGIDRTDPAIESAVARLEAGFRWDEEFGKKPFFEGEVEPCIKGHAGARCVLAPTSLRNASPATTRRRRMELRRRRARARRSTTICARGALEREGRWGPRPLRRRGEEYLLERGLFRRRSTGEVANPAFLTFAFPPRYHYDILRALDYLRDAGVRAEARIGDAVHVVESRRQADGRWLLDRSQDEALALPFGETVGEPSRWNTSSPRARLAGDGELSGSAEGSGGSGR